MPLSSGGFAPPLGIAFYVDRLALLFALAVPLTTLLLWPHDTDGDDARRQSLTLLLAAPLPLLLPCFPRAPKI